MSPDNTSTSYKVCPTCGSRISESATRCLVCGRNLTPAAASKPHQKPVQGPRLPEITLNLPIAIGLFILLVAIGAGVTYSMLRVTDRVVEPTVTPTITQTPTITLTPTLEPTHTPEPTWTLEPPISYTVQSGDSCLGIAAYYNVAVNSIATLNNLPSDCGTLSIGQTLLIPHPTPTASPQPTGTVLSNEATEQACTTDQYQVQANDTLGGIASAYNVDADAIMEYNGMTTDVVFEGMYLTIPLCERLPTAGPTPTPTTPPPYPPTNLLLPTDGAAFSASNETITLQWAAVGTLRQNEAYQVTIEDITEGGSRRLVIYVTDNTYTIPVSFRPSDTSPHVIRWWIQPVRQTGTNTEGQPIYEVAGVAATPRVFSWSGLGITTPSAP